MNIQPVNFSQKRQQNFGMALESSIVERLLANAEDNVKETRAVVELAQKAALNKMVHVVADIRSDMWGSVLSNANGFFSDTYVRGGSFENFAKQVEEAEKIAKRYFFPKRTEIDTLRAEARALAIDLEG